MSNPGLSIVDEEWMQIGFRCNNERFFDYVKIPEIVSYWTATPTGSPQQEVHICTKGNVELIYNVGDANAFTSAIRKMIFHYKSSNKNNQI